MKIVILGGKSIYTNALYHAVNKSFGVQKVIVEDGTGRLSMVTRRIRKLGFFKVFGQILFKLLVMPVLSVSSKKRIGQIILDNEIVTDSIPADCAIYLDSVNSSACMDALKELSPDLILVMGTGIIRKDILECTDCPFINMHMGITPLYRGVHGAYWALADQDAQHCGVTVHLVDEGIDTGSVIEQAIISPTPEDNFATYPMLQYAAGAQLFLNAIHAFQQGALHTKTVSLPSKLRTHPTLYQYLRNYCKLGVK